MGFDRKQKQVIDKRCAIPLVVGDRHLVAHSVSDTLRQRANGFFLSLVTLQQTAILANDLATAKPCELLKWSINEDQRMILVQRR